MIVRLVYQMAQINISTESNIPLTLFKQPTFPKFPARENEADIKYRFCSVEPDALTLPPLDEEEKALIRHTRHSVLESPLVRAPVVRARIRSCLDHPKQAMLELRSYSATIYDFARREADLFFTSEVSAFHSRVNIAPSLYAPFLPVFSTVFLHGCGLVHNNRTALFFAPDGGGKSTIASLATDGVVLSDDHVALRQENGSIVAYGSPWGMITTNIGPAKVDSLFLLEKAERFSLIPLQSQDMLSYLWNEHWGYYLVLPSDLRREVFEILSNLCYQLPAYRLRFPKDYVDWDAIDAAMG